MKRRLETLDTLRGAAVVSMVLFHLAYDVFVIFGGDYSWTQGTLVTLWQRSICFTFIIVSGFVWSYGRRKALKRGLFLTAVGMAVTAVTAVFMPDVAIYFGVMSFFGCAVILMIPAEKVLRRVPAAAGAVLSLFAFFLTEYASYGAVKLFGHTLFRLPGVLYASNIGEPFGFPPRSFVSADYYPIIPWMFLYFFGYFLWRLFAHRPITEKLGHLDVPVLTSIGRHAVAIYVFHQPLCYVLCMLVCC